MAVFFRALYVGRRGTYILQQARSPVGVVLRPRGAYTTLTGERALSHFAIVYDDDDDGYSNVPIPYNYIDLSILLDGRYPLSNDNGALAREDRGVVARFFPLRFLRFNSSFHPSTQRRAELSPISRQAF